MSPQVEEVNQVKESVEAQIMSTPNVVGVGVGYEVSGGVPTGQIGVVVLVRRKLPLAALSPEAVLPKRVDSVPVDVVEVGELRAQQARTDRWRPAPGGVSLGHFKITAGTLGCVVRDKNTNTRLILSNNHVLANSNDATPGDAILQPGPADGGSTNLDQIATLERFRPIDFSSSPGSCSLANAYVELGNAIARLLGSSHRLDSHRSNPQATNMIDAALARPLNDADVLDEILEIGTVSGTVEATLGMPVRKSGRTTGFTTGQINLLNATVSVSYGVGKTAVFQNQLIAGPMSQGGDSGSLVVAGDSLRAVGLLFAGSNQTTIFNPIQAVLDDLQVVI
ncbi:MAG TPA: hypothetical protein VI776_03835 [Anaerolineales bacterium]|jgi:hypothetical protein|nr:hypothetical protein [Anaerolineales bacterium]